MTDHIHKWKYKLLRNKKNGITLVIERICACGTEQWGAIESWRKIPKKNHVGVSLGP
jgi:hypothetical protein